MARIGRLEIGRLEIGRLKIYVARYLKACRAIHSLPFNTHTTEYKKNTKKIKLTDLHESQISKHMF